MSSEWFPMIDAFISNKAINRSFIFPGSQGLSRHDLAVNLSTICSCNQFDSLHLAFFFHQEWNEQSLFIFLGIFQIYKSAFLRTKIEACVSLLRIQILFTFFDKSSIVLMLIKGWNEFLGSKLIMYSIFEKRVICSHKFICREKMTRICKKKDSIIRN